MKRGKQILAIMREIANSRTGLNVFELIARLDAKGLFFSESVVRAELSNHKCAGNLNSEKYPCSGCGKERQVYQITDQGRVKYLHKEIS